MITPDYVRHMAAYNAWQNGQMDHAMGGLDEAALRAGRGAFWGSILGTANHVLWADQVWMARFGGGQAPEVVLADSAGIFPGLAAWRAAREDLDRRITRWAAGLGADDLVGTLSWHSGVLGTEVSRPIDVLLVHMFNHQTHHRGQIHAMLSDAGTSAPTTDLFLMPDAGAASRF
ncbi:DinB family protein [Roseicitreum antarcticum]|uniref:Uncharacterized damage-inducible protein DinB (Forms a four-helix bundle) n=1 Tax=Roseicitreum antarcticum TaxID=564137 RepID=A0A1H2ZW37_9RHOB|nr:DinB family protein [Roseicitreum antarcticum]SDX21566.1 Uncharacterized damage-inducible protein DinB (forms a four-helix bundle) [Roseicitreum antarcticum]